MCCGSMIESFASVYCAISYNYISKMLTSVCRAVSYARRALFCFSHARASSTASLYRFYSCCSILHMSLSMDGSTRSLPPWRIHCYTRMAELASEFSGAQTPLLAA